jgi:hypothetical protein
MATGADGSFVCDPPDLAVFLNRPRRLGVDPVMFLRGWSNGNVSLQEKLPVEAKVSLPSGGPITSPVIDTKKQFGALDVSSVGDVGEIDTNDQSGTRDVLCGFLARPSFAGGGETASTPDTDQAYTITWSDRSKALALFDRVRQITALLGALGGAPTQEGR